MAQGNDVNLREVAGATIKAAEEAQEVRNKQAAAEQREQALADYVRVRDLGYTTLLALLPAELRDHVTRVPYPDEETGCVTARLQLDDIGIAVHARVDRRGDEPYAVFRTLFACPNCGKLLRQDDFRDWLSLAYAIQTADRVLKNHLEWEAEDKVRQAADDQREAELKQQRIAPEAVPVAKKVIYCPILAGPNRTQTDDETACMGDACGWWSDDRCGIAALGVA